MKHENNPTRELNKVSGSKFRERYKVRRQTPEDDWKVGRPK